jgi:hypothetical protein
MKKGNSYQIPELVCGYPRGRVRILPQMLNEILEKPSPSVAAAASTLVYSKAYGGSFNNDKGTEESESDDEETNEVADLNDADYSNGLAFSDKDVHTFDADLEDEAIKTFPRDKLKKRKYSIDGPKPPDLERYPKNEIEGVWEACKKKRKTFNDQKQKKRAKLAWLGHEGSTDMNAFSEYQGRVISIDSEPLMK